MKVLHFILGLVFYSLVAGFGLLLLFASRHMDAARQVASFWVEAPGLVWLLSGMALLALMFAFLLSGLRWGQKKQLIMFENADGRIGVGTDAVKVYLDGLKDEFAAIQSLQSHVAVVRGALAVSLKLSVRAGTQIPELCRLLQLRVKEVIAEHLGACDLMGIGVEVTEIRPGRKN